MTWKRKLEPLWSVVIQPSGSSFATSPVTLDDKFDPVLWLRFRAVHPAAVPPTVLVQVDVHGYGDWRPGYRVRLTLPADSKVLDYEIPLTRWWPAELAARVEVTIEGGGPVRVEAMLIHLVLEEPPADDVVPPETWRDRPPLL